MTVGGEKVRFCAEREECDLSHSKHGSLIPMIKKEGKWLGGVLE